MSTRKCSMLRLGRKELSLTLDGGFPRLSWTTSVSQMVEFGFGEADVIVEDMEERDSDYGPPDVEPGEPLVAVAANVQVRSALMIDALLGQPQACSVPSSLPGLMIGDQVRVVRNATEYALYNVVAKRVVDNPKTVRMSSEARQRLGTGSEFAALVRMPVAAENLTDAQAQAASEMVERLVDDGSHTGLVVIAPHGGAIEFNTDRQAEAVTAALGCSSWICKGWRKGGGTYTRWHITSTKISPNSFLGLGQIARRNFTYAVSFHGLSSGGVLIGGAAPIELKMVLRSAILDALSDGSINVDIAMANEPNSGVSAKNVVNWLTLGGTGGIQLEQGPKVRQDHWQEVANAVISVYSQLL